MEAFPEMEAHISVLWPECCSVFFFEQVIEDT